MLAYFVRRIAGGFVQLLIGLFIIFYIVIELPIGRINMGPCPHCRVPTPEEYIQYYEKNFYIDKPWPLNYVDWLFDPEDTTTGPRYDLQGNPLPTAQKGVAISIGNLQIKGSGALTGDLGISMIHDPGTPVLDMFGRGIGEMFAFLLSLIAALLAIVAAQRWRRPQPYRVSALPTASALVDWWHLHSRSPLDIAVVRRQAG